MNRSDVAHRAFEFLDRLNGLFVDPKDTLVINGFWRSGTTWVQELMGGILEAKTLFEPLQARAGYLLGCLDELAPARRDYAFCNALMPYAQGKLDRNTKLFRVLDRAQRGALGNQHVLRKQPLVDFGRIFNKRVVVKDTRGSLALRSIVDTFECPAIHLYRDPRSVIASIRKRTNWGEGAFQDLPLRAHLLEVDDGRYHYFKQFEKEIQSIERAGDCARLAGYYGLTERCLIDSLSEGFDGKLVRIRYEDLLADGPSVIEKTIQTLGLQPRMLNLDGLSKRSSTQYRSRKQPLTSEARMLGWVDDLDPADARTIESIFTDLGLKDYLVG